MDQRPLEGSSDELVRGRHDRTVSDDTGGDMGLPPRFFGADSPFDSLPRKIEDPAMIPLAFFPNLGTPEIMVILLVGLLLFGGRLPEVGKSIGRSLIEFRKGLRGIKEEAGLSEIEKVRDELRDLTRLPSIDIEEPESPGLEIEVESPPSKEEAIRRDLTEAAEEGLAALEEDPSASEAPPERTSGEDAPDTPPEEDRPEADEESSPEGEPGGREAEDAPRPFGYRS